MRWFREFGRPPRILGLDIARAIAILGMAAAHMAVFPLDIALDVTKPASWPQLVMGHPAVLFGVLAGVSIALMTGRSTLPAPERMLSIRLNLVGRGAVIFVIGMVLELLNTGVAVILCTYGVLYIAVIPFLRWRVWQLLVGAAGIAVLGPVVPTFLYAVLLKPSGEAINFVLFGWYPVTVWMAFLLLGMALGRLHPERIRTAVAALGIGIVLTIVGYAIGAYGESTGLLKDEATPSAPPAMQSGWGSFPEALAQADPLTQILRALLHYEGHSGGTAEIIGSSGVALIVIALCLLLSRPLRWLLLPLAALGSMPLTAYSAHVVVIWCFGPGAAPRDTMSWALTVLGLLVGTTLWSMLLGSGPLERLLARGARAMASVPRTEEPSTASGPRLES